MIRTQEKLKCFSCLTIPSRFILLDCNHLICWGCLASLRRARSSDLVQVVCSCEVRSIINGSPTSGVMKSPKGSTISRFDSSGKSSPKLRLTQEFKVGDSKNTCESTNQQTLVEERLHNINTGIRTFSGAKPKGILIDPLQSTQCTNLTSSSSPDQCNTVQLDRELKFAELQYNKAIEDLSKTFQSKVGEFHRIFEEYKRNLKLWHSQLGPCKSEPRINLSQFVKSKYHNINDQLDRLQSLVYDFDIKKDSKLLQWPTNHKRVKTQIDQWMPLSPQRCSSRVQLPTRYRSPQTYCPNAELIIQRHKFLKRKCNVYDYM